MNRSLLLFACLSLLAILPYSAQADFITVSGDVSGVWDVDSVIVTGEVRVPPGETLQIMPGVEVLFQVYCKLLVTRSATLIAQGTEEDSIIFDVLNPGAHWLGVRFWDASDSSRLSYCRMSNGRASEAIYWDSYGGAILCWNTDVLIQNSSIVGNQAHIGGGIALYNSNSVIQNCLICNNSASWGGGGIHCSLGFFPVIRGNIVYGNSAQYSGGGVGCFNTRATVEDNLVAANWSTEGGGISCDTYSSPHVRKNLVIQNTAHYGGGIYCTGDLAVIRKNVITRNIAASGGGIATAGDSYSIQDFTIVENVIFENSANSGGGICLGGPSNGTFANNTISSNHAQIGGGIYHYYESFFDVINCSIWGNEPQAIVSANPSGLDLNYSDIQDTLWPGTGNISADPLFVNAEQNDYRLLWGSPCIDSGDPDPQFNDPDSTRSDMGAFYYDQSVPVRVLLTPYNAPIQIPPEGGSFDYMITASNCTGSPLTADFWCDAVPAGGSLVGPLFGLLSATIPANDNVSVMRTQRVPGGRPRSITYNGYAAVGADTSKDSFTFWRLAARHSELATGNCSNWGEWFVGAHSSAPTAGSGPEGGLGSATPTLEFGLHPASPNPFNASTVISYELRDGSFVNLCVYDISGRLVSTLVNGWRAAGSHEVTFDASNLASGVYIYRLQAGEFIASQKMILLK